MRRRRIGLSLTSKRERGGDVVWDKFLERGPSAGFSLPLNVSCVKEQPEFFLTLVNAFEDFVNAFTSTTSSLPAFNNDFVVPI